MESEENGNILILPTPIPLHLWLHFYDSPYNSDSNSIASENQSWGRSDTKATGHISWNWLHVTWHCFIMDHWSHARTLAMILTAVLMALCTTQITSCLIEIIQCATTTPNCKMVLLKLTFDHPYCINRGNNNFFVRKLLITTNFLQLVFVWFCLNFCKRLQ